MKFEGLPDYFFIGEQRNNRSNGTRSSNGVGMLLTR
jgi:hypothetical protein